MNCEDARRHWNLYHDSEGDPELYFQINEHLSECASCAEWFYRQSYLEVLIAEQLAPPATSPDLWNSVLSRTGVVRPRLLQRWLLFGGVVALAAGLFMAVALSLQIADSDSHNLARLTLQKHETVSQDSRRLDFTSNSDLEVEAYLRRRVEFPVRCPPRKDTGFIVRGAVVSMLDGQPAAQVFGYVEGQAVSVFILSQESLQHFPQELQTMRGEETRRWREGRNALVTAQIDGNVVLVVGSGDTKTLARVLRAYGTYPHGKNAV